MAWADLFAGIAFYLILEGLFPFASPRNWRKGVAAMLALTDQQLRGAGLSVTIAGLILLYLVRS